MRYVDAVTTADDGTLVADLTKIPHLEGRSGRLLIKTSLRQFRGSGPQRGVNGRRALRYERSSSQSLDILGELQRRARQNAVRRSQFVQDRVVVRFYDGDERTGEPRVRAV